MKLLGRFFDGLEDRPKKILIAVLVGVALILVGSVFFEGKPDNGQRAGGQVINETRRLADEELRQTEKRLENILSNIKGAGRVQVMLTGKSSSYLVMAQDEKTDEQKEAEGGQVSESASAERTHLMIKNGSNSQTPLVVREYEPEIEGALVLCEGAADSQVKLSVYNAVKSLLNVSPAKIEISVYDAGK